MYSITTAAALAPPTWWLRDIIVRLELVHAVFFFSSSETLSSGSEPFQKTKSLKFFPEQIIQKDLEESLESRRTVWTR